MPARTPAALGPHGYGQLCHDQDQEHHDQRGAAEHTELVHQQADQPTDLGGGDAHGVPARGPAAFRVLPRSPKPLHDQTHPHDQVSEGDGPIVAVAERGGHPGGQDEHTAHLQQREQPVRHVVGVVGRGEPCEVHPGPPDGEEHLQVGPHDLRRVPLGHSVTELRHDRGDRHHERQVEQELELRRRSVRLVDGARRHPGPDGDPPSVHLDPVLLP
jgi:hypothetical protein